MLILMHPSASDDDVKRVHDKISTLGFQANDIPGAHNLAIGITGNKSSPSKELFESMAGVEKAISVSNPWKRVSREWHPEDTVIDFDGVKVGGKQLTIMAGPCSVESREQLFTIAEKVKESGAQFLRGGAFKPRTSPYEFQGLKEEGLKILAEARERTGLKIITELKDTESLDMVCEYTDIIQVGARNMQNYTLLEKIGESKKPVLLKRGMSATIKEWLMAAEYILNRGNENVMLCERGIRTFETMTRNTMDIGAIIMLKKLTHLPVIADPSHGIGVWHGVAPLAHASIAAGADGLIVEVHHNPGEALSDGQQSLKPHVFDNMMKKVGAIASIMDRTV
jgi:3-deoxy-7-phosphoheptulonate synthase